jgi:type II secretory pathway component PulC
MKEGKTYYTLALVALLTISAYLLADTVDAMIGRSLEAAPNFTAPLQSERPSLVPRKELSDYATILDRGLFGEGKGPSSGPAAASTVYKLIGTIEGDAFAGAVLEDSTGQAFYRINQKLPDGSAIVRVMRDKIVLRRSDGSAVNLEVVDDMKISRIV